MRLPTFAMPVVLLIATMSGQVQASSEDAWTAFNGRVTKACVAASGMRNVRPSTIIGFNDTVGIVAMLVSDRTRGSSMSKLCLFDKRTGKAYVDDAETWSAPPQPS